MAYRMGLRVLWQSAHSLSQCESHGLRSLRRPTLFYGVHHRLYSTEITGNVIVDHEAQTGIAVMKMNKKPVNSLSLEMLVEMNSALEQIESDKNCRGIILTSANPGVFSAGLDITELYQPQEARLRELWKTFQELCLRINGSGRVFMAAINGHAPAAGCVLSLCCNYRVMATPKFTIGLNETQLKKRPQKEMMEAFWVGYRQSEQAIQVGRLFGSEEALQVGLVDQLADIEKVYGITRKEMDQWLKVPDVARQVTKAGLRNSNIQKLISRRVEDVDNFASEIMKDSSQKPLGLYLENLRKRKS